VTIIASQTWDDGTVDTWEIQTLQPIAWLEANGIYVGGSIDLSKVVDLKEMGVSDGVVGTIGSIEGCPPIAAGPGRVVLTTVNHLNNYVFNLTLTDPSGADDTIGITGYHKVYTEDRGWVQAYDLHEGEAVRTASGNAIVTGLVRNPGTFRVYNMTVEADHVYYVGDLTTLVHNNDCSLQTAVKISTLGRSVPNIDASTNARSAIRALLANGYSGYSRASSNGTVTVLRNGIKTISIYTSTSRQGIASLQIILDTMGEIILKVRLIG